MRPPLIGRLLLRLCPLGERRSDVVADLFELHRRRVAVVGKREADARFVVDVMSLLRPGAPSAGGLRADARDAYRSLRRSPLQTTALFLCLLLGTSLSVVMFTIVNTLFGGALPGVEDRDRLFSLVAVTSPAPGTPGEPRRGAPAQRYIHALPPEIAGVTGIAIQTGAVAGTAEVAGEPVRLTGQIVNGGYFATLGTTPVLGRVLTPHDDRADALPAAVIGHDFWQRLFHGDPSALGRTVTMGPHAFVIVGVLPKGFAGIFGINPEQVGAKRDGGDVWIPRAKATWGRDALIQACGSCLGGRVVLRLAPGVSESQVVATLAPSLAMLNAPDPEQALTQGSASLGPTHGRTERLAPKVERGIALASFRFGPVGADVAEVAGVTTLLMAVPFITLLIAAVNVTAVQVSRALQRLPELASRMALGASRARLVRLLLMEALFVALAAGVGAWLIATQAVRLLHDLLPVAVIVDRRVFVFALAIPMVVTVTAALWPVWRTTGFRVLDVLKQGAGAGVSRRTSRARKVTLSAQLAVSVALLAMGLHVTLAIANMPAHISPRQDDVLVASLRLSDLDLTPAERIATRKNAERALRELAGISTVAVGNDLFSSDSWGRGVESGIARLVSAEWFAAIGTVLRTGRIPTPHESGVLVINEALAERLGGPATALGRTLHVENRGPATVVGVMANGYERDGLSAPKPLAVQVASLDAERLGDTFFLKGPAASQRHRAVREALARVHPQLAPYTLGTVSELVDQRFSAARLMGYAFGGASIAALLLAAVGLFGTMSHSASARTREYGVRLALGARPAQIGRLVVRESVIVSTVGLVLGLGAATLAALWLRNGGVTGIVPSHPVPIGIAIIAVGVIAALAAMTPARRVMSIDPVKTLRSEA